MSALKKRTIKEHVIRKPLEQCRVESIHIHGIYMSPEEVRELKAEIVAMKPGDMVLLPQGCFVEWRPVEPNYASNAPYGLASYQ
jgi:hypothetical protein